MKNISNFQFIIFFFIIGNSLDSYSQFGINWYFYTKNAVKFDAFPPTILGDCQMNTSPFATTNLTDCSTCSDQNGNLLFYSNGDSVYNKNHFTMPNGFDLCTANSTGHISFVVPFVNDVNRFYVFQRDRKSVV